MLRKTWYRTFEVACFVDSEFSEYYKKTGWKEFSKDKKIAYFRKEII